MTLVDFYILKSHDPEACQLFACKLGEKAYRLGHRVYIRTGSERQSRALDDLLWTFRAGSFVPHGLAGNVADTPVIIGPEPEDDTQADVLINVAASFPEAYRRFERVAELVGQDNATKQSGRERYRRYKEDGCAVTSHEIWNRALKGNTQGRGDSG